MVKMKLSWRRRFPAAKIVVSFVKDTWCLMKLLQLMCGGWCSMNRFDWAFIVIFVPFFFSLIFFM
ncbi:unnamed protein product [Brassica oleracea var. botrytis]|uniref:(rape) hypothetical protein n=1 Tax=Brassica napus TaxID=3708 RepID=A0A816JXF7_BRANA|nr:unnamed protein product [Brassica napus]